MLVDLSHPLKSNITVYPGTPAPAFTQINTIEKDGFAERIIRMTTHTGTHMDAPSHIIPNTKSMDQFGLDQFIGRGLAIDCTQTDDISLDFIQANEAEIRSADFVLFYTGWQAKWNTPAYFDAFPTLTTDAVEWLLTFPLKALGFDTISVDKLTDETLPNHHLLLGRETLIIENLTNLDQLVNQAFQFYCIPLNIEAADASPVRAFGEINEQK